MSSDSVRRLGSKNMVGSDCNRHGASCFLPHSGAHRVHRVCTPELSVSLPFAPPPSPLLILLPLSLFPPPLPILTPGWLEGLKPGSSEKCRHSQCLLPVLCRYYRAHTRHQVPYSSSALLVALDTFHRLGLHPVPGLCDDLLSQAVQEYSPFERSAVLWTSS